MKTTIYKTSNFNNGKITLYIMVILFSLLISGCNRHCNTYSIPQDFKQYYDFPVGSYWIYKNQSGVFDTLSIKSSETQFNSPHTESCDLVECTTIVYNTTYKGQVKVNTAFLYDYFMFCCFATEAYFNELTNFGNNSINENKSSSCSSQIQWWMQDTVLVDQKMIFNVYVNKTTSNIPSEITDYPIVCYFKENIGLIKRELQNGELWELIDYKINK